MLKSWGGKKPNLTQLDFESCHQTEAEYQAEQEEWLKNVKKRKKEQKSD